MKSKGFTLIELLAVIVILAIIALIATPVILGIINNVKEESNKRSIEMYAKAIENAVALNSLTGPDKIIGSFSTQDGKNLILTGQEEPSLIVDYDGNVVCKTIEINEDGSIYLAECEVDGKTVDYTYGKINIPDPVSFATDSWQTIAKAVKEGNTNKYKVGDIKEVSLTGFTNSAEKATFTVRIANKSSDDPVCNKEEYSKTACGFVIEFVDIITRHVMNSTYTNVGGWKNSKMREYINNIIYNTFPKDLRNIIIETNVVSGHGLSDTSNFVTSDKLYLLSMKEVYGESSTTYYDTAETETRQLDYYKDIVNVTVGSFGNAMKKLSGEYYSGAWGLRSAYSNNDSSFHYVGTNGKWYEGDATVSTYGGVAPAFRIG